MFSVTPSSVSLPEGGTASVRVTANTRMPVPDGLYSGRVVASDGAGGSLAIPLALVREVESYDLTLRHLDHRGEPTAQWAGYLIPYAGVTELSLVVPTTTIAQDEVLRLPKGRYAYEANVFSPVQPYLVRIVAPNQLLDADKLLVLDGSATTPVTVVSPKDGFTPLGVSETWVVDTDTGPYGIGGFRAGFDGDIAYYRGEVDPPEPTLRSIISLDWVSPAGAPPELYAGAWTRHGRLPESHLAIDFENLATVHAHYHAPLTTLPFSEDVGVGAFWREETGWGLAYAPPVELPLERTEYYYSNDPTVRWLTELWMHNDEEYQSMVLGWVPYEYRSGETYTTHWNQPVFSPVVPEAPTIFDWAVRDGDVIVFQPPLYGDREGHAGFVVGTGTSLLYRDGELIGDSGSEIALFEVPPEPATYRWELEKEQVMFELTPRQKVAWTFPSSHVAEGTPTRIPLLVVRFTPELDERGRAPQDTRFCLPLHVDQLDREAPPDVSPPSVEASYDDGATWTRAPIEASGTGWNAFLDHPKHADYVSLRTSTHDANGNAVEQTLFRAYALKKRR
jgi:hypothetical protein